MDPGIDFSYFTSAPMPYTFFGLPPTPQSRTPRIDDYKNFPNGNNNDHFDPAFAAFQQNFHYDPTQFVPQPHAHVHAQQAQQMGNGSPPLQNHRHSTTSTPGDLLDLSAENDHSPLDAAGLPRSSSEEKDNPTPQQNKRKAQNRAAQRAFRERKEKHVKDLEARNTTLQHESTTLQSEIDRLRRELARATTENEILRATSGSSLNGPHPFLTDPDELSTSLSAAPQTSPSGSGSIVPGPQGYTPTDYASKLRTTKDGTTEWSPTSKWAQFGTLNTITLEDDSGEPLLSAGATWDYIQGHELFKKGLVDVGDVCERLKKMARCDGQGPVFREGDIRVAVQESAVAGGRDELI